MKTEEIAVKKDKEKKKITLSEKLHAALTKMEQALTEYETSDSINHWINQFPVAEYYGNKTFNQIKDIQERLTKASITTGKIKLPSSAERGNFAAAGRKTSKLGPE